MRHRIVCVLLILASAIGVAAEDQPQIAYRILSGYIDKKEAESESGRRIGGTILTSVGGSLLVAGGITYFAGDYLAENVFGGGPMDPEVKRNVSLGLGIGGLGAMGIGAGILAAKPHDFDVDYAEVFAESDSQVREALAVAALKDLAIRGKKDRMVSAISNLAVPLLWGAIRAGMNSIEGRPWDDKLFDNFYWSAGSIASGVASIVSQSEEERLYEKYLAGRDALYGDRVTR
jgi:hypothetical protein